jgi:hypothetical protein
VVHERATLGDVGVWKYADVSHLWRRLPPSHRESEGMPESQIRESSFLLTTISLGCIRGHTQFILQHVPGNATTQKKGNATNLK